MRFHVPQNGCPIPTARYQRFPVRTERQTLYIGRMTGKRLADGLARCQVPQNDLPVSTTGREGFPVRTEGDGDRTAVVDGEGWAVETAPRDIPEPEIAVRTAGRCQELSVRTEGETEYRVTVAGQSAAHRLSRSQIPYDDSFRACRGERLSVRTEREHIAAAVQIRPDRHSAV